MHSILRISTRPRSVKISRDEPRRIIQVTESLTRDNIKREIGALNTLGDEIDCPKRTMITWTGREDAGKDIEISPLWKFLLE